MPAAELGESFNGVKAMGTSTCPEHRHHRRSAALAASLVVFFYFAGDAISNTSNETLSNQVSVQPTPSSNYTSTSQPVQTGNEAFTFSARLVPDASKLIQDIDWEVKTTDGKSLFKDPGDEVYLNVKPGTYVVSVNYGNVHLDEALTVPAETHVSVSFILNAGVLRVLPHLANLENISATPPSEARVYGTTGKDKGKLVATSKTPGEMLKLAAGTYRLSTSFAFSNTEAVNDIEVKAGVIRAVDIGLHAGLTHFTLNNPLAADWKITADDGRELGSKAKTFDAVLKPGHYVAEADFAGRHASREFTVEDGQEMLLVLPN